MTNPRSLLSVRLEPGLAESLERHCAQTGQTRSQVVKQSVAQYLAVTVGPTLGSLAEGVLPALPDTPGVPRTPRQQRFREHVRAKRRR
jgi:hypothetical protein